MERSRISSTATLATAPVRGPGLVAGDLDERVAVATHRREQDDHVVNGAAKHGAEQDPERAGQHAVLRGEHGPDQRPGGGDRGEVVAEQDEAVGLDVIAPVGPRHAGVGRRSSRRSTFWARNAP
jgi:hypothetical protein